MKQIILILVVCLWSCTAQNKANKYKNSYIPLSKFNQDTSRYVKTNFTLNKSKYIGKPISFFLRDWELPVKSFLLGHNQNFLFDHVAISMNTSFEVSELIDKKIHPKTVYLMLQTPLNDEEVGKFLKKRELNWTNDANVYLGKQIIKDIDLNDFIK